VIEIIEDEEKEYESALKHISVMWGALTSRISQEALRRFFISLEHHYPRRYLPIRWSIFDAGVIFLYWLVLYPTLSNLEDVFGVRSSDFQKLIRRIPRCTVNFVNENIVIPNMEIRQQQATALLPEEFRHCHFIIDGTDTRCWLRRARGEIRKHWYSFKHKRSSFRIQVAIDLEGRFVWFGEPLPAAIHDKSALEASDFEEQANLEPGERVLADKGYVGSHICTCPYKKPPRADLTDEQKIWNRFVNRYRAPIELRFGIMKNRYAIMRETFRHQKTLFRGYMGLVMALSNLTLDHPGFAGSLQDFVKLLPATFFIPRQADLTDHMDEDESYDSSIEQELK